MKKTIYASSMFFACALAFVSCGQKTPEMTLEEIGAKFDLTRERVRQIKEKAIRRLKGQKSKLLKSYLG